MVGHFVILRRSTLQQSFSGHVDYREAQRSCPHDCLCTRASIAQLAPDPISIFNCRTGRVRSKGPGLGLVSFPRIRMGFIHAVSLLRWNLRCFTYLVLSYSRPKIESIAESVATKPIIGAFSMIIRDWIPLIDEYYYCGCCLILAFHPFDDVHRCGTLKPFVYQGLGRSNCENYHLSCTSSQRTHLHTVPLTRQY